MTTDNGPCPAGYYPPPGTGNATYYEYHGSWCLNTSAYFDGIAAAVSATVHVFLLGALLAAAVGLLFRLGDRRKWRITGTLALTGLAVLHPAIFAVAAGGVVATGGAAWWLARRHPASIPADSGRKED